MCCGSWVDSHCCHRKELISNPFVGETRQLYFLAYRHTRSFAIVAFEREKMPKLSDCLTSAQPRSLVDAHFVDVIWSSSNDAVGLYPGGAGAVTAYILADDLLKSPPIIHCRVPFYSRSNHRSTTPDNKHD